MRVNFEVRGGSYIFQPKKKIKFLSYSSIEINCIILGSSPFRLTGKFLQINGSHSTKYINDIIMLSRRFARDFLGCLVSGYKFSAIGKFIQYKIIQMD